MRWTAITILLALLQMAGQQATAENEPKVITLSCSGTVADTSSGPIPADHKPKPLEKMGVVANLNDGAVSFIDFVAPISSVDAASFNFNGGQTGPVAQIARKEGDTIRIDGYLDRVTGHMVADIMTYQTKELSGPNSSLTSEHFDMLCKVTNRVL
jgi:hypothetical protein